MKINNNDQNKIDVRVIDPSIAQNHEQYVIYHIEGIDQDGNFDTLHRFSDFAQLRSQLCDRWNYCYIPSLPEKILSGNLYQETILQRTYMLDYFMKTLSKFLFLWYSNEVQGFIRPQIERQQSIPHISESFAQLLTSTFPEFVEQNIDLQNEAKIEQFSLFIQNAKSILLRFKEGLKIKMNQFEKYCDQMTIFKEFFIPEYEVQFQIKQEQVVYRSSSKIYQKQNEEQLICKENTQFQIFSIQLKIELNEYQVLNSFYYFKVLLDIIEKRKLLNIEIENLRCQLEKQVKHVASLQNGSYNVFMQLFVQKETETEKQLEKLKQLEQEVIAKQQIYLVISNKFAQEIDDFKITFSQNYYKTIREIGKIFKKSSEDDCISYQNMFRELTNMGY